MSVTTVVSWLQLPGANSGGPDVKGAAEKAAKKSPFGYMHVGELAFDLNLPGSNVKKTDLPNGVKPGDAAGLPKGPTAEPPSTPDAPSTPDLPDLPSIGNPVDQVIHSKPL